MRGKCCLLAQWGAFPRALGFSGGGRGISQEPPRAPWEAAGPLSSPFLPALAGLAESQELLT